MGIIIFALPALTQGKNMVKNEKKKYCKIIKLF